MQQTPEEMTFDSTTSYRDSIQQQLITLSNGGRGIRHGLDVIVREPDGGTGGPSDSKLATLDFIASTDRLDRYGEIIEPDGWRLDNYRRNPVFQNSHQYGDIIFTLGKALITEVRTIRGKQVLYQRVQFALRENPLARIAYGLYRGGFLNAVSVGFVPLRWEYGGPGSAFRRRYLEQELIEVSAVGVPANPEALQLAVRSGAIRVADLDMVYESLHTALQISADRPTAPSRSFLSMMEDLLKVINPPPYRVPPFARVVTPAKAVATRSAPKTNTVAPRKTGRA